jgi:hypothetical protein
MKNFGRCPEMHPGEGGGHLMYPLNRLQIQYKNTIIGDPLDFIFSQPHGMYLNLKMAVSLREYFGCNSVI